MRHADLLREATAGIAKPASARCMILQCGTWYGCVAVWPCVCLVVGWEMRSVQKTRVKLFRLSFSTGGSKKSSFSTGSASRNSQSQKVESKKPFFDCVRKPDLGFSRKRPFSTDKIRLYKKWPYKRGYRHPFVIVYHTLVRGTQRVRAYKFVTCNASPARTAVFVLLLLMCVMNIVPQTTSCRAGENAIDTRLQRTGKTRARTNSRTGNSSSPTMGSAAHRSSVAAHRHSILAT